MSYKLLENQDSYVNDFVKSFCSFNKEIIQIEDKPIVIQRKLDKTHVGIISGGGSGHEPLSIGFVGKGMLSGSVGGKVFTSPNSSDILRCIYNVGVDNANGVLLIVLNYTGDRLNFSIAANRAKQLGINVETVFVGEDCSNKDHVKFAGRRGLAGATLIYKIAGGMVLNGESLTSVRQSLQQILDDNQLGTIGISFSGCSIPFSGDKSFTVPVDSYVLGLGIHGETGVKVEKFVNVAQCIALMTEYLFHPTVNGIKYQEGDEVVVLVNNLGSCHSYELFSFAKEIIQHMTNVYKLKVMQCYCGTFVTSLDMKGVSVSVLNVQNTCHIKYLKMPTDAEGWPKLVYEHGVEVSKPQHKETPTHQITGRSLTEFQFDRLIFKNICQLLISVCDDIISNELYLNELDKEVGDYDCGSTAKRGAMAVRDYLQTELSGKEISSSVCLFSNISQLLEMSMGGTSGGILSLFFENLSTIRRSDKKGSWADLFLTATKNISEVTKANKGDRTMLDVMFPVFETWQKLSDESKPMNWKELLNKLTEVSESSSKSTIIMVPKAGRASYARDLVAVLKKADPGAELINIIVKSLRNHFTSSSC